MGPTNIVAHELESHGVRTFSAKEMAFNILGLMHPLLFSITQVEPIWADLNGGMDRLPDLADITTHIRSKLKKKADLCCAKWKLKGSLQLKAVSRWHGSWDLSKDFDGRLKDGLLYVGWVDSKTNEPVDDKEVKGRYEK